MEDNQSENIQKVQDELKSDIINKAKKSDDIQVKRVPTYTMSSCAKADTMMPVHFAPATLNAFFKLQSENVNFDEYVIERLSYPNKLAMCNGLNAEQVDAVALAVYQIERRKSLIVGDMAGIGKGRIAAAVLRYAYQKKKIPIFITERPNLFSDLYRDIYDIGGFGLKNNNNPIIPKPLILNGYKANDENSIIKDDARGVRSVLFPAQKNAEIIQVLSEAADSGKFPFKDYQLICATYSQFQTEQDNAGNDKLKVKYLKQLAEKAIFVLDESHNAVGLNSGVGKYFREIAALSSGCLFMSATSAKEATQLQLYGIKTDITESSAKDPKRLLDIIKKGGEPMSEYLSTSLASVGQQIRRERSFEKCNFEYLVIDEEGEKKRIYELYDRVIEEYDQILKFMKGVQNSSTTEKLVKRVVRKIKNKYPSFNITNEVRPQDDEELEEWYKRNEGLYEYFIDFKAVKSTRFNVIDTLVMAIKADYVAKKAVEHLTLGLLDQNGNRKEYEYLDGTKKLTTIKPIIAVRNTLDNIWDKMGYNINDEIKNPDFKIVLQAALQTALNPNIRFRKVIFETDEEKRERKKKTNKTKKTKTKKKENTELPDEFSNIPFEKERIKLNYDDFEDKGEELKKLEARLDNFVSNVFISPIDKIIDIIENTPRNADDNHGEGNRFFRVAEVSGRKRKLVREGKKWYLKSLSADDDDKNAFDKFKGYNNGKYDCLIINEVGSTGASAQASPKYKDSRPRSMIIHQVELDVNTEVQKRGRINRTGQICLPTYTYLTSPIPSEIRRLLMLKRKLRSLDSLTTGSQKQSDELATFKNKYGQEIKDFYNYIGLKVLNDWLNTPDSKTPSEKYTHGMYDDFFNQNADHIAKSNRKNNEEKFVDDFCRIMELAKCDFQEDFYDSINSDYIKEEIRLLENNNYLLETTVEDLASSVKAKAETKYGLNTSPFNQSVFDEELYVSIKNPCYTKLEVEKLMNELAENKDTDVYWKELKADYLKEYQRYIDELPKDYPLPSRKDFKTKEEYEEAVLEVETRKTERIEKENKNKDKVYSILEKFRPNKEYSVPNQEDFESAMEEFIDKNGVKPNPNKEPSWINKIGRYIGKFVGYNIDSKSKFKYSNGSIELVFAFIDDLKKITIKPTTPLNMDMLEWIGVRYLTDEETVRVTDWDVTEKKKTVQRYLTGNIIDALNIAEHRKKQGDITSYKYIKYTTLDNDIKGGVHLRFGDDYVPLKVSDIKPSIPSISPAFASALEDFDKLDYAHSQNAGGGATERFDAIDVNGDIVIKLTILGEKVRYDAVKGRYVYVERQGEKYKSKFFEDKNLQRFIKDTPKRSIEDLQDYVMKNNPIQSFTVEQYTLNSKTDREGLFKYMYEIDKSSFKLRQAGESPENIRYQPRPDDEEQKQEEKRDEGNFEYSNIVNYKDNPEQMNIPYYVSYKKGESQYVITTSRKLNYSECLTYSLIPLNLTDDQMAKDFFVKFTPTDRVQLKDEINKLYKGDDRYYPVGAYISKLAKEKYGGAIYVFGKLAQVPAVFGEFIYNFVNSDKADVREETKKESERAKKEEVKVEIKALNEANVQDYLILLKNS